MSIDVQQSAPAAVLEAQGREFVLLTSGTLQFGRVVSSSGEPLRVDFGAEPVPVDDAASWVLLPHLGETVSITTEGGVSTGYWVGLAKTESGTTQERVTARVVVGTDVVEHHVKVQDLEARTICRPVTPSVEAVTLAGALRQACATTDAVRAQALVQVERAAQRVKEEQTAYIDRLVSEAHDWADDNDLCGRFDAFMRAQDLPARSCDFSVTVHFEGEVEVQILGDKDQDPTDLVTDEEVRQALENRVDLLAGLEWRTTGFEML